MKRKLSFFLLLLSSASLVFGTEAKDIVDKMEEAMNFQDASFHAKMTNTDRFGSINTEFDAFQRENGDTLLVVTSGPERGQKTLRLENDIYIYYPDADEVVRLSKSGLKDSFLGSDFSYEDLTGDDDFDARYDYELEGQALFQDRECFNLFFKAKSLSETYQMQRMLVDCELFIPLKVELYSKSGRLLKEIYYTDYVKENGTSYPTRMEVVNTVKKGNSSLIVLSDLRFNTGLDDELFSIEELAW